MSHPPGMPTHWTTYNNNKPWLPNKLRKLCQAKEEAHRPRGDRVLYKQARNTLRCYFKKRKKLVLNASLHLVGDKVLAEKLNSCGCCFSHPTSTTFPGLNHCVIPDPLRPPTNTEGQCGGELFIILYGNKNVNLC